MASRKGGPSNGCEDPPNKRKRIVKFRRSYTPDEELKILDKLKETITSGREIEKPNATEFYRAISEDLNFPDAGGISISNKVRAMKKKYDSALKWRNSSGEGLEGETLQEKLQKICPNFDLLDEIYGSRITFNPYYESESGIAEVSDEDEATAGSIAIIEDPLKNELGKLHKKKEKPESDFVKVSIAHKEIKLAQYSVEEQKIQYDIKRLELDVSSNEKKLELESRKVNLDEKRLNMEEKLFELQCQKHGDEIELKREELNMKLTIRKLEMEHELKMAQLK